MRRGFVVWHRWFGLLGGVWLFIIALTGSIIVFQAELDAALNPRLFEAGRGGPPTISVGRAAAVAEAHRPGFHATHVLFPQDARGTYQVFMTPDPGNPSKARPQAFVDAHSGDHRGARDGAAFNLGPEGIVSAIYKLHYKLHAGDTVELLLGILAALWLLDHVAAVALSFPSRRRWRHSFRVPRGARGHRLHFSLHRAVGLWLLPVTAVLAFSGVYFNWRPAYDIIVGVLGERSERADQSAPPLPEPLVRPPISFDAARSIAAAHAPGVAAGAVTYASTKGLYLVRLFDPRDPMDIPQRMVAIDAVTGRIRSDRHMTEGSAADLVTAWQFPLHSGGAFGWPGRLLVCAAGVATCGFVVTGFIMWRRKHRARAAGQMRRTWRHLPQAPQPAE